MIQKCKFFVDEEAPYYRFFSAIQIIVTLYSTGTSAYFFFYSVKPSTFS